MRLAAILVLLLGAPAASLASMPRNQAERLADAIYVAEGGSNTRHPYGILKTYVNTTPRQACLNTINHQWQRWVDAGRPGPDFIEFLGRTYCPVGAKNDPGGLNRNWVGNVRRIYRHLAAAKGLI